jgi:hypothetical protein
VDVPKERITQPDNTQLQFANAPSSKTASAAVESRHLVAGAFSHVLINDNGDAFFCAKVHQLFFV